MGISWELVVPFIASGIVMALLSCLIGIRPKIENPIWWVLYAVWVGVALLLEIPAPFYTLFISSILAGLFHGATSAILLERYIVNNPWHAERMQGPRAKLSAQFVIMGVVVGAMFGAVVAGIAWGITHL